MTNEFTDIKAFLEYRGFAFERSFRALRDAYTFSGQFLAYHDNLHDDYKHCLEVWLATQLGVKWYNILCDELILTSFDTIEQAQIRVAWGYWLRLVEDAE